MGHVHRVRAGRGHGAAVVVGAGGYDSDWDCELVVRVPDGLVYLGNRGGAGSNLFDACTIFCLGCSAAPLRKQTRGAQSATE